jgi:exopolysaccharide biosynthesis polyprenyl glycosylphosphotransferase
MLVDILCVGASFLTAYWFRLLSTFFPSNIPIQPHHFATLGVVCLLWTAILSAHGLYRREVYLAVFDQMVAIFNSVNLGVLLVLALAFVLKFEYFLERRLVLLLAWSLSILILILVRVVVLRGFFLRGIRRDPFRCRILVVGAGESGRQFVNLVKHTRNHVYEIVGYLDDDPAKRNEEYEGHLVLGTVDDIRDVVEKYGVERVFVAIHKLHQEGMIDLISRCMKSRVPVKMISDQFHMFSNNGALERVDGVPTLRMRENPMSGVTYTAKAIFDVAVAAILLVVLAPFFALIAAGIKLFGGPGPVLFRQSRAGHGGKPFDFYKFRTMRTDINDDIHRDYAKNFVGGEQLNLSEAPDTPVYKMKRDPRVTAIGSILRKTSLDELPQLFNVLRGEMSLVGPRPPILYELQYYKEWHKRRLDAKPGLTGLWQVSGRSSVPFNEMVLLDLYYIDHWSLKLDFEILLRTIPVILFGKGAY